MGVLYESVMVRYYNTLIKYSLYEVMRFAGRYYNTLIKYSLYEVF
jgi:hypothetical protein